MNIIVAIKACQNERQYPGLGVIPARPEESDAKPVDVRKPPVVGLAFEIATAPQCSISDSEGNDLLAEPKASLLRFTPAPAHIVVLAVGVVVSLLSAANFISHEEHEPTLREHQNGEEVLDMLFP
jgi:hypothetical protein